MTLCGYQGLTLRGNQTTMKRSHVTKAISHPHVVYTTLKKYL